MTIQKPKGTADLLPKDNSIWHYIEETVRILMADYQFSEIRTPIFENYELFSRSTGETSDIVSKEMYDFYDKGNRHIALRPEGTAGVVRAYVENKLYGNEHAKPLKVFYMAPMFRYERPQGGRLRQFHQIGTEVFGSLNPAIDVEVIALAWDLFKELGLKDIKLVINSLGKTDDRKAYRQALIDYLTPFREQLSPDSKARLDKNPLRILDSKDENDKKIVENAPSILEYLSEESKEHFNQVKSMLEALNIPYTIDSNMVRGLDYYEDTIFEMMTSNAVFGAQTTICGGGRYDGLVQLLNGPETPSFGFGIGIERLALLMEAQGVDIPQLRELDVYVIGIDEQTNVETLKVLQAVRQAGYSADRDYLNRKLKAQFKTADKLGAKVVLIIGEDELSNGIVTLKVLKTGKEVSVPLSDIYENFEQVFRTNTMDTSVLDEYFSTH
ncbi:MULTISPECIES: histidine--tRNA ligase [unclassified Granulicatella]|uniref:histidine--tRNA ligase n=1 Tax=unclassified Granulicatella TaxID=2630493 RepID=UPI0010741FDA|nr:MULTISPECIES: histidine--tRNA ligase [unclassified Granulicatella]MBF0780078.1 histidine--tRNA ligase [Granulicatella sp. 19428wC4_WM01]TFU95860.1 histidine--tRNA ligase [Granulicatella sp. WM01]